MNPIKLKVRILFVLGVAVAFLSEYGIPGSWKTALGVLLGIAVSVVTYLLHRDLTVGLRSRSQKKEVITEAFREADFTGNSVLK